MMTNATDWTPVAHQGPSLARIPRWLAEDAFSIYAAKYGVSQTLDRLLERGGFADAELDAFVPGWRERIDRLRMAEERIAWGEQMDRVRAADNQANAQRFGQRLFNTLVEILPAHAERIRGTDADPFYDDDKVPALLHALTVVDHDAGVGFSATEPVDNSGELPLELDVYGVKGTVYLSREMWHALGERAGWVKP